MENGRQVGEKDKAPTQGKKENTYNSINSAMK
jgi:hypothetical protein